MNKPTGVLLSVTVVVLCLSSWAWADAAGDYEALFGQEEKAAAAKGAVASAEFAARLLNAAKSSGGQKDLQALLCDKAYEFGIKAPVGYQTAADAMKLLIETMPDKKLAAQERLLKVHQIRYARSVKKDEREKLGLELVDLLAAFGDDKAKAGQEVEAVALYRQALTLATTWKSGRTTEIMDRIKQLSAAQEAERRIAVLKARLEKDPKDAAARTALVMAYLGEQDDPNEAVKLLTADVDEGLRTYVPLAAKKVEELEEAACIQLAEWFLSVSEKSSPAGKSVLLYRALACCERYLKLHTTEDAALLKGKMLLEKVGKALYSAEITLALGNGVTMKLVLIPAGKFMMGSPETEAGRESREGPQHEVTISRPFYMGVYEVTQEQYEAVMGMGTNPGENNKGASMPIGNVLWSDAVEFCRKVSAKTRKSVRLPTEAQWEYACRAGTKTRFSFGDDDGDLHKYGNYADRSCTLDWLKRDQAHSDGYGWTAPVGSLKPNAFGLYDMHGNVREWCTDWFADSYAHLPAGQAGVKNVDPQGPASGESRVLRGGEWCYTPQRCRSAFRDGARPDTRNSGIGFRVLVDPHAGQAGMK